MAPHELIAELRRRGLSVVAKGGALHVSPSGRLTEEDRQTITDHKAELLALLSEPWDQAEADRLVRRAIEIRDDVGHSISLAVRWCQFRAADAIDEAYQAGDMIRLRRAVEEFLTLLPSATGRAA